MPDEWDSGPRQEAAARQTNIISVTPTLASEHPRGWAAEAAQAIRQLASSGRGFDASHVIAMCGPPEYPQQIASVFASAQRSKTIECVGARVAPDGCRRVWWASS